MMHSTWLAEILERHLTNCIQVGKPPDALWSIQGAARNNPFLNDHYAKHTDEKEKSNSSFVD
jgi:hypothetical protein